MKRYFVTYGDARFAGAKARQIGGRQSTHCKFIDGGVV